VAEVTGKRDDLQGAIVHEYDGIEEADNVLPRWWLAVFIGSIVFAVGYWLSYGVYGQQTPRQEYAARQAELDAARLAALANAPDVNDEVLNTLAHNGSAVAEGAAIFKTNCVACHGEKGEGKIGPNLTDRFWLHGAAAVAIHHTIEEGVPAKGMPTWGPLLGRQGVQRVAAFVLSIRNSEQPGKPPQGDPEPHGTGS
jgi:cytochrome c oxidase cbb3-type subunit 3